MNCEQLEGESPEDTCERLCGYYKFFCPAYAEAHNEIDLEDQ
jgi:hypothetical protein